MNNMAFACTGRGMPASARRKAIQRIFCLFLLALSLTGCASQVEQPEAAAPTEEADNVQAENQQTPQPPVEERPVETPQIKEEEPILKITVGEYEWTATFADNCAADEFQQLLAQGGRARFAAEVSAQRNKTCGEGANPAAGNTRRAAPAVHKKFTQKTTKI